MKTPDNNRINNLHHQRYLLPAAVAVGCLTVTFAVASSEFDFVVKLAFFASTLIFYLAACAAIYTGANAPAKARNADRSGDSLFSSEIEAKLLALDEANRFFGASLKPADMFRLIANRINEIIPYAACAVYTIDEKKEKLKAVYADSNLQAVIGTEINPASGFVGKTFESRQAQIEKALRLEKSLPTGKLPANLNSAIAVPLLNNADADAYGVLVLYGESENSFDAARSLPLIKAVAVRVAPLFLSSRAFENSLHNALTDALTALPNERAFYLVLENQIAAAQRFRDDRPLTVLSIDIVNFGDLNQRYGHATGDHLLRFAAEKIKNQLRAMDFLARSGSDEFLAVLPTASPAITLEIIERLEKSFTTTPFEISENEQVHLRLACGASSFGKDGETPSQLLKHALIQKQQSKSTITDSKILFFPKEYVN